MCVKILILSLVGWLVNRRRSNPAEQQQNLKKVGSERIKHSFGPGQLVILDYSSLRNCLFWCRSSSRASAELFWCISLSVSSCVISYRLNLLLSTVGLFFGIEFLLMYFLSLLKEKVGRKSKFNVIFSIFSTLKSLTLSRLTTPPKMNWIFTGFLPVIVVRWWQSVRITRFLCFSVFF